MGTGPALSVTLLNRKELPSLAVYPQVYHSMDL